MISYFLLSLKKDSHRREQFYTQKLSKPFQIFYAVDAKEDLATIQEKFDFNKARELYGRNLSNGEAACSLSHLAMYEEFLKTQNQWLVICEDDALFNPDFENFNFAELFKACESKFKYLGIILFGKCKTRDFMPSKSEIKKNPMQLFALKNQNVKVGRILRDLTVGSVGYAINRQAASQIIKTTSKPYLLADDFSTLLGNGFYVYNVFPHIIIENQDIKSNLEAERKILQDNINSKKRKRKLLTRLKQSIQKRSMIIRRMILFLNS